MIDRKQLKAAAKAQIAQSDPRCWQVMAAWALAAVLLPQVVLNLVSSPMDSIQKLSQLVYQGIDPELALRVLEVSAGQVASSWALSLVLNIYQMVLTFGLVSYALRLYRGQGGGVPDLFSGFAIVGRVIGQQVLVSLIVYGCAILLAIAVIVGAVLCIAALGEAAAAAVIIAGSLAILALVVVVVLNYALVTVALADRPELGAMGSIQYGKNLMRGYKGDYFLLCLSFVGWSILCSLPSGIFVGVSTYLGLPIPYWAESLIGIVLLAPYYLWLLPYIQTATAGFYDALRQEKEQMPAMPPL